MIIILPKNFVKVVYDISRRFDRFLICGERIDVDITDLIEFNTDWELEMTKIIAERGRSMRSEELRL